MFKPKWYQFNNQPLNFVRNQLSFYYQVNMDYKEEGFRHCYLSAPYSNGDSISTILHDIALLNQLVIDNQKEGYII